ncbi:hypothetical protein HanIR_Chr17g0877811 [Helianthus annuus]|nr:hypothetical protein HanIR_Chr17g0877811 [Helianthus annuus]
MFRYLILTRIGIHSNSEGYFDHPVGREGVGGGWDEHVMGASKPYGLSGLWVQGKRYCSFVICLVIVFPGLSLHILLCFSVGYSLLNMFDPNVGGAIVVAALPEGQPGWVDQIRNNFLHPSSESMTTYPSTILGDDGEGETDVDVAPTWEELKLLSSEQSASSYQDLIHCSSRAGPQRELLESLMARVFLLLLWIHKLLLLNKQKRGRRRERRGQKKKRPRSLLLNRLVSVLLTPLSWTMLSFLTHYLV